VKTENTANENKVEDIRKKTPTVHYHILVLKYTEIPFSEM